MDLYELYKSRNFGPFFHKFGALFGAMFNAIDQFIFRGNLPITLNHPTPDHECLKKANEMPKIEYQNLTEYIHLISYLSIFI